MANVLGKYQTIRFKTRFQFFQGLASECAGNTKELIGFFMAVGMKYLNQLLNLYNNYKNQYKSKYRQKSLVLILE